MAAQFLTLELVEEIAPRVRLRITGKSDVAPTGTAAMYIKIIGTNGKKKVTLHGIITTNGSTIAIITTNGKTVRILDSFVHMQAAALNSEYRKRARVQGAAADKARSDSGNVLVVADDDDLEGSGTFAASFLEAAAEEFGTLVLEPDGYERAPALPGSSVMETLDRIAQRLLYVAAGVGVTMVSGAITPWHCNLGCK